MEYMGSVCIKKTLFTVFAFFLLCSPVFAQDSEGAVSQDTTISSPEKIDIESNASVDFSKDDSDTSNVNSGPNFDHYYEDITLPKLSKLYWRLGMLDMNDESTIDNFLKLNECDIYKEYRFNEFDWKGVQAKALNYIKENANIFPDRFKFEQPLFLGDYNMATKRFEIIPDYQIKGMRKFEVQAEGDKPECVDTGAIYRGVKHYPETLIIEMNQPINLVDVPVNPQFAQDFIKEKADLVFELPAAKRSGRHVELLRQVYIVYKIRIFSYKGMVNIRNQPPAASVYALLEGYEIYADPEHEKLMYFQNFTRETAREGDENRLKEQFEAMKKRRGQ